MRDVIAALFPAPSAAQRAPDRAKPGDSALQLTENWRQSAAFLAAFRGPPRLQGCENLTLSRSRLGLDRPRPQRLLHPLGNVAQMGVASFPARPAGVEISLEAIPLRPVLGQQLE